MKDGVAAFEFTLEELEIIKRWHSKMAEGEFGPLSNLDRVTADIIQDAIPELKPKVSWTVKYVVINKEPRYTTIIADNEYQASERALEQATLKHPTADEIDIVDIKRVDE